MTDPLARLARTNVTAVFLGALAFILVAFFAPGIIGSGMLVLLAVALGALMTRTWPVQPARTRVVRLLLIGLLIGIAAAKLL